MAVPPATAALREKSRPWERGTRRLGSVIVVIGVLLLGLAAEDALAHAVLGGGGDDTLRGSGEGERLVGFGGEDTLFGVESADSLSGGGGDDELYGGPGRDVLLGGAGGDFVEARDGEHDHVWCGTGDDVVGADLVDRVARDCETLYAG